MEKLPQELVNQIASNLLEYATGPGVLVYETHSNLARYATISRSWKEAIEQKTFHKLILESTDLEHFEAIATGNRRLWVGHLELQVVLDDYPDEVCGLVEDEHDRRLNNETFTRAIQRLFSVLSSWDSGARQRMIVLRIRAPFSPKDRNHRSLERQKNDNDNYEAVKQRDIFERRYEDSFIELLRADELPVLNNISVLRIVGERERNMHPHVAGDLGSKVRKIQEIQVGFNDADKNSHGIRRANRYACAQAFERCHLPSLKIANVNFQHFCKSDQNHPVEDLLPENFTHDPLSASLRILSYNLTSLDIHGVFDSSLFWPYDAVPTSLAPTWPHLKMLKVDFDMQTPSGGWYFTGTAPRNEDEEGGDTREAPPSGDYYWKIFRTKPDQDTLEPFLLSFAKAAVHMPVLETADLTCELQHSGFQFEIKYAASGQHLIGDIDSSDEDLEKPSYEDFNEQQNLRQLWFAIGSWRLSKITMQVFKNIGKAQHGSELMERYGNKQIEEYDEEDWLAM
ncbi:hypothetical protein BDV95DRAFT_484268 [Massariosphaeria phaeospora]|uniref:F-box domain-containing protein n=1 Tax=Massariosphaeria phaeospora TaxID=100035 RepID=A0A7C8MFV4_9PLEO|nr:hypothetical protein BDV95DRAFT_484268 [Massariosphaeria phaeospora]